MRTRKGILNVKKALTLVPLLLVLVTVGSLQTGVASSGNSSVGDKLGVMSLAD